MAFPEFRMAFEGHQMRSRQSVGYKLVSLLFLVPGVLGLVFSSAVSTHFRITLPTTPVPNERRMTPRNISGVIVYVTVDEERQLNLIEYSSAVSVLFGLCLGCVYAVRWGTARAIGDDAE
jgi:hypothetical protein